MKKLLAALLVVALFGVVGCPDKGSPGGPGVKDKEKDKNAVLKPAEETFSLSVPGSMKLKQGESKDITIGIKRGKNFGEDVTLKFSDLPKGVAVDPATPTIKASDKEVKVTVKAADDAGIGDFTVKIIGHPEKGADATNELKLTVEKK